MAGDGEPTEGLTVDGRFVSQGNSSEDLTDQIICGTDKNGDIIRCAEVQPVEFVEKNWYEDFDFDAALFSNYGKDWWLGLLYKPARMGLLGSTPKGNVTEAGDYIYECLNILWNNKRHTYLLMRAMFRIANGMDEYEAEIESCLSQNPDQLRKFQDISSTIDRQMANIPGTLAGRVAGGAFVGFSLRRIRIPRKLLQGRPAPVRHGSIAGEFAAKMTLNFAMAGWGGMLRAYLDRTGLIETRTQYATSWVRRSPPTPLELLSAALLGDSKALSLGPDEIRDLSTALQDCGEIPEDLAEELRAFSMLLDVFKTFYEDRR